MSEYIVGPTTEDLKEVYWAKVIAYNAGATWIRDRGREIPIYNYTSMHAKEFHFIDARGNLQVKKKPFALEVNGSAVIEYSQDEHEPFGEGGGGGVGSAVSYGATGAVNAVFTLAGAGAAEIVLAANPLTRSVTLQNVSANPIYVSRLPGISLTGVGADVLLSAGTDAGGQPDGTGGVVRWDGFIGDVYARPKGDSVPAILLVSATRF